MNNEIKPLPGFLSGYEAYYETDPRTATLQWFREASFGLFIHYGVYSLLERGEWVQFREQIPVAEYEKLKDDFTAENFDADFITDLMLAAGMTYVTITTRHHDSFCLFATEETDFNSVAAPCGRDLIGELTRACAEKGLGIFYYYSYALDWRHPHFLPRGASSDWANHRPDYASGDPAYKYEKEADFEKYIAFMHAQLTELLTNYGPIAGIWFDPIMGYYGRPDMFPLQETYALIRSLQPHALIAFKQGANGEEDFASCERDPHPMEDRLEDPAHKEVARHAWAANRSKHNEICDTLQPGQWGYNKADAGSHRTPDEVLEMLEAAHLRDSNLLLNTGPLPDGSIDPEDVAILREVGKRLRGA